MSGQDAMIRTEHLHRIYHTGGEDVHAINDVSLEIQRGLLTAVIGRSGAGKTTLLNLLAGLDDPTEGEVWVGGRSLTAMTERQRIALRREKLGFVFQTFGLLPLLTAEENVGVPLRMRGMNRIERDRRVQEALDWVGLGERSHHRPYELSGGEQQRVAVARAMAAQPELILADEPTGQLDSQTGKKVLQMMRRLVTEKNITMVVVTHDPQIVEEADIVHELRDGHLVDTRIK